MKKKTFLKDFGAPVLVLFLLAMTVAALLAIVNTVTSPVIEENNRKKTEENRKAALPMADGFTEVSTEHTEADSIAKAKNGKGYVITAKAKGYGGLVTVTVGIDETGEIVNVLADVTTETKGVGSKAGKEEYLSKYKGNTENAAKVDTISQATYSSTAVKTSVLHAIEAWKIVTERNENGDTEGGNAS